ncbi:MAG TPA: cytochrome P450 [Candidatus Hydrogenedentes bacterium]|nr:cytochrome P450 [Candidatus Hydrogenedentota bacterium]
MPSSQLPPGPRGKFLVGSADRITNDRLRFLMTLRREYGEVSRFTVWGQQIVLITRPDHVKEILVTNHKNFHKSTALRVAKYILGEGLLTSEDALHRRQRRMMQPAFHSQRIHGYAEIMIEYAARHAARWETDGLEGHPIDMWQEMMRLTLAIVAKTLFDADVESEAYEIGEALSTIIGLFERVTHPAAPLLTLLPTPKNVRFLLARKRINATILRIIGERRASGKDHGDLLSMLLRAQDEDDGGTMTDKQVRDEVVTLFLAGHETTANALTFAWHLLSRNPDVEEKFHAEIDTVLEGRLPVPADYPKLEYTRRVFAETMRLYPPAYLIGRTALETFTLDGYTIPKGAAVLLSPFVTQHDAAYFPDPEVFDPDRFSPEAQQDRHKFAYYPFGSGPRTCIGEPFAWMEGVFLMAVIAQRWRMRTVPGHPIEFDPQITLRPAHGMSMTLARRETSLLPVAEG